MIDGMVQLVVESILYNNIYKYGFEYNDIIEVIAMIEYWSQTKDCQ